MRVLRPRRAAARLDLTPLIDVVFQLLIFFLLSSTFLRPALKIALPTATTSDKSDREDVVVTVESDGSIFVNAKRVALADLRAELAARLVALTSKRVSFWGDKSLHYEIVVQVMDLARLAGASELDLIHESPSRKSP